MNNNRRKIGIGIAVCACVLLIGAGLYLTRNNKQETQESSDSAFVPDLDPDASTQEAKESDPPVIRRRASVSRDIRRSPFRQIRKM